jgi:HTH-type transcriptional regulator / antitoxin HipB
MDQIVRTPQQMGAALRRIRRQRGLSQGELAARAHLRQATISEVEAGKGSTRLDTIISIMVALDLEMVVRLRTSGAPEDIGKVY